MSRTRARVLARRSIPEADAADLLRLLGPPRRRIALPSDLRATVHWIAGDDDGRVEVLVDEGFLGDLGADVVAEWSLVPRPGRDARTRIRLRHDAPGLLPQPGCLSVLARYDGAALRPIIRISLASPSGSIVEEIEVTSRGRGRDATGTADGGHPTSAGGISPRAPSSPPRRPPCHYCDGLGRLVDGSRCPWCRGAGSSDRSAEPRHDRMARPGRDRRPGP